MKFSFYHMTSACENYINHSSTLQDMFSHSSHTAVLGRSITGLKLTSAFDHRMAPEVWWKRVIGISYYLIAHWCRNKIYASSSSPDMVSDIPQGAIVSRSITGLKLTSAFDPFMSSEVWWKRVIGVSYYLIAHWCRNKIYASSSSPDTVSDIPQGAIVSRSTGDVKSASVSDPFISSEVQVNVAQMSAIIS
jgi:hypothetical protein